MIFRGFHSFCRYALATQPTGLMTFGVGAMEVISTASDFTAMVIVDAELNCGETEFPVPLPGADQGSVRLKPRDENQRDISCSIRDYKGAVRGDRRFGCRRR